MTQITITHPELVKALVKPPADIMVSLSQFTTDLWHGATGVAGETGELLEAFLDVNIDEIDRINLREEMGDIYFYVEQLVQRTQMILDWDNIYLHARNAEITPDRALYYAAKAAVYGSQVLDTVKKASIYNKALDHGMLNQVLSNMLVHVVTLGYMFGIDHTEALAANIQKLSKRYASLSYSDKAAQERADKTEPERKFFSKPDADPTPVVQRAPITDYRKDPEAP